MKYIPNNKLIIPYLDLKHEYHDPHLFVVKNFSNCYGIPGLRLAVLASGDEGMIKTVKREMPMWNFNSFAEFYLQIAEKYKEDYENALGRFREERERFSKKLADIEGMQVISSRSDFLYEGGAYEYT